MKCTLFDKVVNSLKQAGLHNSGVMVKPEVILWPDPERQWEPSIPVLRNEFPALLSFGVFNPEIKQGPAIWIKCMVAKMLVEANWPTNTTPIIYLPGISKNDLKNISVVGLDLQPIMEYQYTGTIFSQVSGREWTVLAFMENEQSGLGLKVTQDKLTRDTLVKVLPIIFQNPSIKYPGTIDVDFLNSLLFPDVFPNIIKWMCNGDDFIKSLTAEQKEAFINICRSRFDFVPDYRNIKAITEKLGLQHNAWKHVWELFAQAPKKYPQLEELLRLAKPEDMGVDLFAVKEESWPQVNEDREEQLRKSLENLSKLQPKEAMVHLEELESKHFIRRDWVWAEFGYSPLAKALPHLLSMAKISANLIPSSDLNELKEYYIAIGYKADQSMRKALVSVKLDKDKKLIKLLISTIYKPWLESITQKFQLLIAKDSSLISSQKQNSFSDEYILFVDAFRFELASEFVENLDKQKYKTELHSSWSAIPSLTPTSKPMVSPIANDINPASECVEFRPQLKNGKDLQIAIFRNALKENGYTLVTNQSDIVVGQKHWQEIGDIDTRGHEEQSELIKRVEELFDQLHESIVAAFDKGITRIKIVTDHGWLLLPGGLPKEELNKNLTETRWGRCALIKEGAKTELMHLPWHWNPSIHIAYAPGISFFKKNEEYAHGGISIHECLSPIVTIEKLDQSFIAAKISKIKWVGLNCKITTIDALDGYLMDIRNQYNDPQTSIVLNAKSKRIADNKISLMVDSDAESKSAIVVLMDESEKILDKKPTLVGT